MSVKAFWRGFATARVGPVTRNATLLQYQTVVLAAMLGDRFLALALKCPLRSEIQIKRVLSFDEFLYYFELSTNFPNKERMTFLNLFLYKTWNMSSLNYIVRLIGKWRTVPWNKLKEGSIYWLLSFLPSNFSEQWYDKVCQKYNGVIILCDLTIRELEIDKISRRRECTTNKMMDKCKKERWRHFHDTFWCLSFLDVDITRLFCGIQKVWNVAVPKQNRLIIL